jgi:hypothetical protein
MLTWEQMLQLATSFFTVKHILRLIVVAWFCGIFRLQSKPNQGKLSFVRLPSAAISPSRNDSAASSLAKDCGYDDETDFQKAQIWIESRVPKSTAEERYRFMAARKGDKSLAAEGLERYLDWNTLHRKLEEQLSSEVAETGEDNDDENLWNTAVAIALKAFDHEAKDVTLPQIVRTVSVNGEESVDREGHRIMQFIPAKMDERLASLSTYALALALYIDRKLARDSREKISVLIDVRAGEGWRNLNAAQLIPFIRDTCSLLLDMFPERLARSIVFPVPMAFLWIWNIIEHCFDEVTSSKIRLLTGKARSDSPPPSTQMAKYLEDHIIQQFEQERLADFDTATC